jgi:hypothetical protein
MWQFSAQWTWNQNQVEILWIKLGGNRFYQDCSFNTSINICTYKTEQLRQGDMTQASYLGGRGLKS